MNGRSIKRSQNTVPLDNCAAHPKDGSLENCKLAFLLPNTTSALLPLRPVNHNICNCFKKVGVGNFTGKQETEEVIFF